MPEESEFMKSKRLAAWRELEAEGVSRTEIARRYNVSRQLVCSKLGPIEGRGDRDEIHIYMNRELFEIASDIAAEHGLRHNGGKAAGQGSVGKLLEKVATGELMLIEG